MSRNEEVLVTEIAPLSRLDATLYVRTDQIVRSRWREA
jgi:hypothetical protein